MIMGETLTAEYRFRCRAERGPRLAREIEQDMRQRERDERIGRRTRATADHTGYPATQPVDSPSYR